jgi:hypothetical protein
MFIMSRTSQRKTLALNTIKNIVLLLAFGCSVLTVNSLQATPSPRPTATDTIFGNWIIDTPEQITLLQLNRDHSYLYMEFNLTKPQNSVAEWGQIDIQPLGVRFIPSYSNNQQQGLVAYQINHLKLQIMLTPQRQQLAFTIDTNADSVADEQYQYHIYPSQSVYGVWHELSRFMLSSLVLLDNGYYAVVQINLHQDPQINPHYTHLQWGRFERQQNQLFIEPIFDNPPQQSVSQFDTMTSVFYHLTRQQLALSFAVEDDNINAHQRRFRR